MFDVVCLGDATQDNFFFINDASVHCDINNQNCTLNLKYGQKIPAEKFAVSLGGNAANVACSLSKLGIKTALSTSFGDDDRGAWIKRKLLEANVDLSFAATDPNRESNISAIIIFKGERTILTHHDDLPVTEIKIPETRWIYLTSAAGRDSSPLFTAVRKYKEKFPGVKVAFNPYVTDLQKGKEYLSEVLRITDLIFLNKEEAEALTGKTGTSENLAKEVCRLGPKMAAVTDGARGATVFAGGKIITQESIPQPCLQTTGAGDAFAGGFLAGLILKNDLATAVKWGIVDSGSVITKIGAQAGLLSQAEIEKAENI